MKSCLKLNNWLLSVVLLIAMAAHAYTNSEAMGNSINDNGIDEAKSAIFKKDNTIILEKDELNPDDEKGTEKRNAKKNTPPKPQNGTQVAPKNTLPVPRF